MQGRRLGVGDPAGSVQSSERGAHASCDRTLEKISSRTFCSEATMRRLVSIALAGSLLAACSEPFTPENVAGRYNLVSVNGKELPATETNGATVTYKSGSIDLTEGGSYSFTVSLTAVSGGVTSFTTVTGSGSYTLVEPSTIRFEDSGVSGTKDGNRITLPFGSDQLVFEK